MKKVAVLILFVCCCGCETTNHYALQPGDKVFFIGDDGRPSVERAAEFRYYSGNDINRKGSVVEITEPTALTY